MYYLKLFDKTLITFDMKFDMELKISNIKQIEKNKEIFPIILQKQINEQTIEKFITSRIIPKNRAFVKNILESAGLNMNNKKGIIDISKGLSLIDSYWIVEDDNLKFADYNLFDNDFSEILSLVAFTGYSSKIDKLVSSPELTTNGALKKCWRRINMQVYLYKGGNHQDEYVNIGNEPYNEYYASQVAKKMGIDCIEYGLDKWKGTLASTCKLFTSKNKSYIQIGDLMEKSSIVEAYNICKIYGFEKKFADMILFDSIIINEDRHFGNFGLLRDNKTGKFIDFAPIFDNGASLMYFENRQSLKLKDQYEKIKNSNNFVVSYYGIEFDRLVATYCYKEQIDKLRNLLTFNFEKHPKYNLSDTSLKILSNMIQDRARHFIDVLEHSERYIKTETEIKQEKSEEILEIDKVKYENYDFDKSYYKFLYIEYDESIKENKYHAILIEDNSGIVEEEFLTERCAKKFLNNEYLNLEELHKEDEI